MLALGTQPCLGRPLSRSEEDMRLAHNPKRVVPTAVCVVTGKAGRSREVAVPAAVGPVGNLTALAPKCQASEISGPSAWGISTRCGSVPPWEKRDRDSTSRGAAAMNASPHVNHLDPRLARTELPGSNQIGA